MLICGVEALRYTEKKLWFVAMSCFATNQEN
jgi:hypothetical protein